MIKNKYNKGIRHNRIATKGHQFFVNVPEERAAVHLHECGRRFSKRGYPDLTVYNDDGTIYGFIEVKPNDERFLKDEQDQFGQFCRKHSIPFMKWCPDHGREKIEQFLEGRLL
jgi:hypothetical protein